VFCAKKEREDVDRIQEAFLELVVDGGTDMFVLYIAILAVAHTVMC
jgi:hypothetical protein